MDNVFVPDAAISGNVMLYRKPELLSKDLHSKLGVNPPPIPYEFAVNAHVCPITVPEFGLAAADYPIIFVGDDRQPLVVFGLSEGQNLFATREKGFDIGIYMPFFIRRYPFILAAPDPVTKPADDDKLLVGIDRGYEHISENAQFPFFNEAGEPSEYTQQCIQLCNNFEMQVRMTMSFVQLLKDLDLLEAQSFSYPPPNADGTYSSPPQKIAEYYAVTEAKMRTLSPAKLAELRDNGALQQIYAHMNSLIAWERLIVRALARQAAQTPVAANA